MCKNELCYGFLLLLLLLTSRIVTAAGVPRGPAPIVPYYIPLEVLQAPDYIPLDVSQAPVYQAPEQIDPLLSPQLKDPKALIHNLFRLIDLMHETDGMDYPIQAKVLPPMSKIIPIGDIHGDATALRNDIMRLRAEGNFKPNSIILSDDSYLVFIGDYVDRGIDGVEVWNILAALKKANPEPGKIILLRGNHEQIGAPEKMNDYWGFKADIDSQIPNNQRQTIYETLANLYEHLPVASLLGIHNPQTNKIEYLIYCHGSLDANAKVAIKYLLKLSTESPTHEFISLNASDTRCFTWNDLRSTGEDQREGRAGCWSYSHDWINNELIKMGRRSPYIIKAMIRGHQHTPGGILKLTSVDNPVWQPLVDGQQEAIEQGDVFMFMSCPGGQWFNNLLEEAYGVIQFDANNQMWSLTPHIVQWSAQRLDEFKQNMKNTLLTRLHELWVNQKLTAIDLYFPSARSDYGTYAEFLFAPFYVGGVTQDEIDAFQLNELYRAFEVDQQAQQAKQAQRAQLAQQAQQAQQTP